MTQIQYTYYNGSSGSLETIDMPWDSDRSTMITCVKLNL